MALPSLYYTHLFGGVVCATDIRCLIALLDREQVRLNEESVPTHFLFGLPVGQSTYFRDIWRLFPGQMLRCDAGSVSIKRVTDLRGVVEERTWEASSALSSGAFYERMSAIMGTYLDEAKASGMGVGNLLSGDVDSSLIQMLINDQGDGAERGASFSFAFETNDDSEKRYANHASKLLNTQHIFCDIPSRDYPELLTRSIETLAQPNLRYEGELGKYALAGFLAENVPNTQLFFAGQGADGLHGFNVAKKIALVEKAKRIPGSHVAFQLMASSLAPWATSRSRALGDIAKLLAHSGDETATTIPTMYLPTNLVEIRTREVDTLRRWFGDQAIQRAFDARRSLEADCVQSASEIERAQMIGFLTTGYGHGATVSHQFFSAHRRRLVQFFLDEDVIRMTVAVKPETRFLKRFTTKPLLKQILARQSLSILSEKAKLGTTLRSAVVGWMKEGPLAEMVRAIDVPSFVSKPALLDEMLTFRDIGLLWNLLTFHVFQERMLK